MIHPCARAELTALAHEYRAAESALCELRRRLQDSERDLARDPVDPAYVVEHAVARSLVMTASANAQALREALDQTRRP
jgi:hypothetical protein